MDLYIPLYGDLNFFPGAHGCNVPKLAPRRPDGLSGYSDRTGFDWLARKAPKRLLSHLPIQHLPARSRHVKAIAARPVSCIIEQGRHRPQAKSIMAKAMGLRHRLLFSALGL